MKIFKLLPIFMLVLAGVSCTKVKTINTKEHSFNTYPEKLIFIQVPGLSEEHLAYLKYKRPLFSYQTWAEGFSCFGKMWRYNLHELRPSVEEGTVSQITGYSGSKKKCDLYSGPTLWSALNKFDYESAVVERGNAKAYESAVGCKKDFYKDSTLFISAFGAKKFSKNTFHHERENEYKNSEVYIDQSCKRGECFSKSAEVFFHAWNSLKNKPKKFMLFKDYSLLNAIRSNNTKKFLTYLEDFNKMVSDINRLIINKDSNTTLIISSTSPQRITWPTSSRNWNRVNLLKSTSDRELMAPIWATGAMSENFCGIYAEHEVFNRVFWRPKKTKFPLMDALGF